MNIIDKLSFEEAIRNYKDFNYDYTCVIPTKDNYPKYFSNSISYVGRSYHGLKKDIFSNDKKEELYNSLNSDIDVGSVLVTEPRYVWFCNRVIICLSDSSKISEFIKTYELANHIMLNPLKRIIYELDNCVQEYFSLFNELENIQIVETVTYQFIKKYIENVSLEYIKAIINYLEFKGAIKFTINEKYEYHSFKTLKYDYFIEPMKHHVISAPEMKFFRIVLTEKCPMKCVYCYYSDHYDSERRTMTHSMLRNTIDKIADLCVINKRKEVYIQWWGGDPSEEESLVEYGTIYAKEVFNKKGIIPFFYICSGFASNNNGDFYSFVLKNRFNITMSLDGDKELHNKHKILTNDKNSTSYDKSLQSYIKLTSEIPTVKEEFDLASEKDYSRFKFRCTLNSYDEILKYNEVCNFFNTFNRAYRICISSDKNTLSKKPIFIKEIITLIKSTTNELLESKYKGLGVENLTSVLCNAHLNPQCNLKFIYSRCGFAGGIIIINPIGELFSCHRFCDNKEFCIGNIASEYNEIISKLAPLRERWLLRYDKCVKCSMKAVCTGGCAYEAYEKHGTIWKTHSCISFDLIKAKSVLCYIAYKTYPELFERKYNIEDCSNVRCLWC